MATYAQWGPSEPPRPSEPKAMPGPIVFGALSLVVSGLAFAAAVVSTIGMAVGGEPYAGGDLASAVVFGSLGAIVLWIGWRARRRDDPASRAGAAILARLAPVLTVAGLVLGVAAGVWMTVLGLEAAGSIDRGHCSRFTGPLRPRDPEACRAVARECRHQVRSGPVPPLPRGVDPEARAAPEGVDMPSTAEPRAIVTCMLEQRDALLR